MDAKKRLHSSQQACDFESACVLFLKVWLCVPIKHQVHWVTDHDPAYMWIFSGAGRTKQQQGVVSVRRKQKERALQLRESLKFVCNTLQFCFDEF